MTALIILLLNLGASLFKPNSWLEAENAALRQQLVVLQRQMRGRAQFTNSDRLFFIQLYRWFPSVLKAMTIMRPETVMRWHRAGFRRYWRWKSRNLRGRPKIAADLRALIRRISVENRLWGAPRIHGELLKLGFAVAQSTVAKYMASNGGRVSRPAEFRHRPLAEPSVRLSPHSAPIRQTFRSYRSASVQRGSRFLGLAF